MPNKYSNVDVFFDVYPHPAKPYFEAQLTEWQRQGCTLRLFSLGAIPGASSKFSIQFIHTLRREPVRLALKILWRALTSPRRVWRIVRTEHGLLNKAKRLATDVQLPRNGPDLIFIHNLATALHFSYLKNALPNIPLAIYYHGGEIPGVRQISLAESSRALGRADLVFSNTRASVAEAVSRGAHESRASRIPVGFPLERFPRPDNRTYLPNGVWRFVCLGRMAKEKGFDVVLKTFAALKEQRRDFHLTLIGGGPELAALKALTETLSLSDHVTFSGFIDPYSAMITRLATFDALVFSSIPVAGSNFRDTQACVMQEAMLMGASVIASDIGGIRESLPPLAHPYLYTPGSTEELLTSLQALMQHDAASLKERGNSARQFVIAHYDIGKVNQELFSRLELATT